MWLYKYMYRLFVLIYTVVNLFEKIIKIMWYKLVWQQKMNFYMFFF